MDFDNFLLSKVGWGFRLFINSCLLSTTLTNMFLSVGSGNAPSSPIELKVASCPIGFYKAVNAYWARFGLFCCSSFICVFWEALLKFAPTPGLAAYGVLLLFFDSKSKMLLFV